MGTTDEPPRRFDQYQGLDRDFSKDPLISVVMCAYNGLPYIEEAVDSILRQTYLNLELVISDDGSSDGTREWLRQVSDPRVRIYYQSTNLGYVRNKNFAHAQARGEFITQQDNDDISTLDRIERQYRALQKSHCRIAACGYFRIDRSGKRHAELAAPRDVIITRTPNGPYPFWFPALLIHRSVFEAIGVFDEYFAGAFGDDLYWTVKANERFPIYALGVALYGYRDNPTSITSLLDNPRKLVMPGILLELRRQRAETGTDLLEQGSAAALQELERQLLTNRRYRASQLRIWAARAVDSGNLRNAKSLLLQSWISWPFDLSFYRTAVYYARSLVRR
jgi:glycosyltransferase involved in cell wall biosynthesis